MFLFVFIRCVHGVEVCVVPATAQNVAEQHVRCTLVATFPSMYPSVQPVIKIRYSIHVQTYIVTV